MKTLKFFTLLVFLGSVIGCNDIPEGAKPIDDSINSSNEEEPYYETIQRELDNTTHKVVALETMDAAGYVYVKVKEGDEEYWIAASKMAINIGETYYYSGGLYTENFLSKQHDRVFDKLILVNSLIAEDHGPDQTLEEVQELPEGEVREITIRENGSLSLAGLIYNAANFEGRKIRVEGKCTKVNEGIMDRNWVHLNDGTNEGIDFIATTTSEVKVGDEVLMEGILALNKDFGAGYVYPIILENCDVITD